MPSFESLFAEYLLLYLFVNMSILHLQNKEILYHHVPELYLEKNEQEMNLNLILATYILKGMIYLNSPITLKNSAIFLNIL